MMSLEVGSLEVPIKTCPNVNRRAASQSRWPDADRHRPQAGAAKKSSVESWELYNACISTGASAVRPAGRRLHGKAC
jgi:hypothetical protein